MEKNGGEYWRINLDLLKQSGHKEESGNLWLNFPRQKYACDSENDCETRQRVQHRLCGMWDTENLKVSCWMKIQREDRDMHHFEDRIQDSMATCGIVSASHRT